MTKQEALIAMEQGNKVTHYHFSDDEYVYIEDGKMYTEDGYRFEDGWEERTDSFETGWEIKKIKNNGGLNMNELKYEHEENYARMGGKPYYERGEKIGRNQKCTCGSGKKYKKCCGK